MQMPGADLRIPGKGAGTGADDLLRATAPAEAALLRMVLRLRPNRNMLCINGWGHHHPYLHHCHYLCLLLPLGTGLPGHRPTLAPHSMPAHSLGFMPALPGLARAVFPRPFPSPGGLMPSSAPAAPPQAAIASQHASPAASKASKCWHCGAEWPPPFLSQTVFLRTGSQMPIFLTIVAALATHITSAHSLYHVG